jgi:hypothetical protein
MPIIPSAAAGGYGTGATWVGGLVPLADDQIDLLHDVSVSDARVIGTSPAGTDTTTYAVDIRAAGRLTITSTGSLSVRGPARTQNIGDSTANLIAVAIADGGVLQFDGTQAADPATATYRWTWGNQSQNFRYMDIDGGTLQSVSGAGNGNFTFQFRLDARNFAEIRRIGTATTRAFIAVTGTSSNARWRCKNVWFDTCGGMEVSVGANTNWLMEDCVFTGTTHTDSMAVTGGVAAQQFLRCDFDRRLNLDNNNMVLADCWIGRGIIRFGAFATSSSIDSGVFYTGQFGAPLSVNDTRTLYLQTREVAANNTKFFNAGATARTTLDMVAQQFGAASTQGEFTAGTSANVTHDGLILLPYADGTAMHAAEILDNTSSLVAFINCTLAARGRTMNIGHAGHTTANNNLERVRFAHTLFANFAASVSTATKCGIETNNVLGSYVTANCTNNGSGGAFGAPHLATGSQGAGYDAVPQGAAPGATDVDGVDPQFVGASGSWADVFRFGQSLGLSGTRAEVEDACVAAFAVRQLAPGQYSTSPASYIAGCTHRAAHTWIRQRMRPQNAALFTNASSNNGGWIGAVEGVTGGLSAGARRQYRTNILRMVA